MGLSNSCLTIFLGFSLRGLPFSVVLHSQLDSNNSVDLPRGPSVVAYTWIYVSQLESFLTLLTADLSKDNYVTARK